MHRMEIYFSDFTYMSIFYMLYKITQTWKLYPTTIEFADIYQKYSHFVNDYGFRVLTAAEICERLCNFNYFGT